MFIDLSSYGPLCIDPSRFPTTLVVQMDSCDEHSPSGVISGRHEFEKHEEEKQVPIIESDEEDATVGGYPDDDRRLYLLDRTAFQMGAHMIRRWTYAAIDWKGEVFLISPHTYKLTLQVLGQEKEEPQIWSVSLVLVPNLIGFTLNLPDYQPDAVSRGVVRLR